MNSQDVQFDVTETFCTEVRIDKGVIITIQSLFKEAAHDVVEHHAETFTESNDESEKGDREQARSNEKTSS
jgi:hypothetical protein